MISDEFDAHGLSLFFYAVKKQLNYVDLSILNAENITKKLETLRDANSLLKLDVAIVADLPIDMSRPDEVIMAYEEVAKTINTLVFLDHHPTSKRFEQQLKDVGVIPIITSGVGMSVWLQTFLMNKELPPFSLLADDTVVIKKAIDLLYHPLFKVLLLGNFADMDYAAALIMKHYPDIGQELNKQAIGFDVLTRVSRLGILKLDKDELFLAIDRIIEMIESGEIEYPPAIYSKKILRNGERFGDILVYYYDYSFPIQWLNRSVAFLLNTHQDIRYVVVASSGRNERIGKYQTLVCIYTRWFNIDEDLTKLTAVIADELKELTKRPWYNFGHKTFSCSAVDEKLSRGLLEVIVRDVVLPHLTS